MTDAGKATIDASRAHIMNAQDELRIAHRLLVKDDFADTAADVMKALEYLSTFTDPKTGLFHHLENGPDWPVDSEGQFQ
ncbi:MAG: hypothetical protein AAGA63_09985 [Pseudomonadota bacterium]